MDAQDIPLSAIQPGQEENFVAGPETTEALDQLRLEHQPRLGRTLVGLPRRRRRIVSDDSTLPIGFSSMVVILLM
jgi:hypothetical protein